MTRKLNPRPQERPILSRVNHAATEYDLALPVFRTGEAPTPKRAVGASFAGPDNLRKKEVPNCGRDFEFWEWERWLRAPAWNYSFSRFVKLADKLRRQVHH